MYHKIITEKLTLKKCFQFLENIPQNNSNIWKARHKVSEKRKVLIHKHRAD